MNDNKKKISIRIPCFNEKDNVKNMAVSVKEQLDNFPQYKYEIIFTDNCSTDGTREILRKMANEDEHIKLIFNTRNYGAGTRSDRNSLKYALGDAVIGLPCDFQTPVSLISIAIKEWEKGYKIVYGQRTSSEENKAKYYFRTLFYKIIGFFSEVPQNRHMVGFSLLDSDICDIIRTSDADMEIRNLVMDIGYDIKLLPYHQAKRASGKSSYNVFRHLSFAINVMLTTSTAPLRIATIVGCIMSGVSFIIGSVYLVAKIIFWDRFIAGTAPILIGMFFLGAVQVLFIGLVGEYVGLILKKVTKQAPVQAEKINFEIDE